MAPPPPPLPPPLSYMKMEDGGGYASIQPDGMKMEQPLLQQTQQLQQYQQLQMVQLQQMQQMQYQQQMQQMQEQQQQLLQMPMGAFELAGGTEAEESEEQHQKEVAHAILGLNFVVQPGGWGETN